MRGVAVLGEKLLSAVLAQQDSDLFAIGETSDAGFAGIVEHVLPYGIWTRPITRKQLRMMNSSMPSE